MVYRSGFYSLFFVFIAIVQVFGDAVLYVRLEDYNNTGNLKADGSCCDGQVSQNGLCTADWCDYDIKICTQDKMLRNSCIPSGGKEKISLPPDSPSYLTFPQDIRNKQLALASWTGQVRIFIDILDDDAQQITELVDSFDEVYKSLVPVYGSRHLNDSDYRELALTGNRKRNASRLRISVAIACRNNFYRNDCSVFCIPSNDCHGHYSCNQATGEKMCDKGWEGTHCDKPKIGELSCPASVSGCRNGGTCAVNKFGNPGNQFYCCCPPGFSGALCEEDVDECTQKPCRSGTCNNFPGSYNCTCATGYTGQHCERVKTCNEKPCQNSESCMDINIPAGQSAVFCLCKHGYTGTFCEQEMPTPAPPTTDPTTPITRQVQMKCPENYCRKNGVCVNGTCQCQSGFSGILCEKEILECAGNPCKNGGLCRDLIGNYTCECLPNFSGKNCEQKINKTINSVRNISDACSYCGNGTCKQGPEGIYCACDSGFIGKTCTHAQSNCNTYLDAFCFNANTCKISGRDKKCKNGWQGPICRNEYHHDGHDPECPDINCKNDGHCFNGSCCCRDGFTGKYCEEEILVCSSWPCQNNATCISLLNAYKCQCLQGFTGVNCEYYTGSQPPLETTSSNNLVSTTPDMSSTTSSPTSNQGVSLSTASITDMPTATLSSTSTKDVTLSSTMTATTSITSTTLSSVPETSTTTMAERATTTIKMNPTTETTILPDTTTTTSTTKGNTKDVQTSTTSSSSPATQTARVATSSKEVTTGNSFTACIGRQCFMNGTCIDASGLHCICFLGFLVQCSRLDTSSYANSQGMTSSPTSMFQTTTFSIPTDKPITTTEQGVSYSTSTVSTVNQYSKYSQPSTSQTVQFTQTSSGLSSSDGAAMTTTLQVPTTTLVSTALQTTESLTSTLAPVSCGKRRIYLNRKILLTNIDKLEELINRAIKNTTEGKNCSDIQIQGLQYVYNIRGNVLTEVIYNASECCSGDNTGTNSELIKALNTSIKGSNIFNGNAPYSGDVDAIGAGYKLYLIGYVYDRNRELIKNNIKKSWTDANNNGIDALIVNVEYYIGDYGTLLTEISYLITSGLKLLPSSRAHPPSQKAMRKVFEGQRLVINNLYTGDDHLAYKDGIRLSLRNVQRAMPMSTSRMSQDLLPKWTKYFQDRGQCPTDCDVKIVYAPTESSSDASGHEVSDIVYFVQLDGKQSHVKDADVPEMTSSCNCTSVRQRYVDISGRIKLKDTAKIQQAISGAVKVTNLRFGEKRMFWDSNRKLVTRMTYTHGPTPKMEWPNPNMDGGLDMIFESLKNISRSVNTLRVTMMHDAVFSGVLPTSKISSVTSAFMSAWSESNPHIPKKNMHIHFEVWESDFYSDKDGSEVTKTSYSVTVVNADSSTVDVTAPISMQKHLQKYGVTQCHCVPRKVRIFWINKVNGMNTTTLQHAIASAWENVNPGVGVAVKATVKHKTEGYETDTGEKAEKVIYYISPTVNGQNIDENDLDKPDKSEIEANLPGVHVYVEPLSRSKAEKSQWWIYLAIGLGILALLIIILIAALVGVRHWRNSQSKTLNQDPKLVSGFNKEHFSKEPDLEKNGFMNVNDPDEDGHHKRTYVVNS